MIFTGAENNGAKVGRGALAGAEVGGGLAVSELKISKYRTFTIRTKLQAVLDVQNKKV